MLGNKGHKNFSMHILHILQGYVHPFRMQQASFPYFSLFGVAVSKCAPLLVNVIPPSSCLPSSGTFTTIWLPVSGHKCYHSFLYCGLPISGFILLQILRCSLHLLLLQLRYFEIVCIWYVLPLIFELALVFGQIIWRVTQD